MSAPNLGKKGGGRFTIPSKYLLFLFSILCILLMTLTFRSTLFARPFNSVAGSAITPVQRGITFVGEWLRNRAGELAEIRRLQEENAALRKRVDELRQELACFQTKMKLNVRN